MQQTIKNVILWNYGRTAWQYDVLCVLILAFIFLTPTNWFSNGKERAQLENAPVTRLIVNIENLPPNLDEQIRLERIRELTGNKNANIVAWRERKDADGRLTAYEIDVR